MRWSPSHSAAMAGALIATLDLACAGAGLGPGPRLALSLGTFALCQRLGAPLAWPHYRPLSRLDVVALGVLGAALAGFSVRSGEGVTPHLVQLVFLFPFAEEFVWRGMVQPALRQALGPVLAVGVTAVLFFGLHAAAAGGVAPPHALVAGVLLGIVRERNPGLVAPTALHAAGNLALFLGVLPTA